METNPSTVRVSAYLPAAIILVLIGGGGWYWVTQYTDPSGGTRWLFFFSAVLALTGLALPITAFLNRRFPSRPPATGAVITRQALWIGMYLPLLLWFRLGRVANLGLALLLAAGLILIEFLLRLRERSAWKPERQR